MNREDIIRMAREAGFAMENSAAILAAERFAPLLSEKYKQEIQDLEDMLIELQERQQ